LQEQFFKSEEMQIALDLQNEEDREKMGLYGIHEMEPPKKKKFHPRRPASPYSPQKGSGSPYRLA